MDSGTGTYVIWAGNSNAVSAPFSVTRAGAIKSTSGSIGGWDLSANSFHSGSGTGYVALNSAVPTQQEVTQRANNAFAIWAGDASAKDAKFSVEKDGSITALDGNIGGWNVTNGILSSGSGTGANSTYVALNSDANSTYAIWAGSSTASSAPFRVERNGSVYLTKLFTVDEDGQTQKDVSGMLWKLSGGTIKNPGISCSADASTGRVTITIHTTNGDYEDFFIKASEVNGILWRYLGSSAPPYNSTSGKIEADMGLYAVHYESSDPEDYRTIYPQEHTKIELNASEAVKAGQNSKYATGGSDGVAGVPSVSGDSKK